LYIVKGKSNRKVTVIVEVRAKVIAIGIVIVVVIVIVIVIVIVLVLVIVRWRACTTGCGHDRGTHTFSIGNAALDERMVHEPLCIHIPDA